jgi:hypothetical protein
LSAREVYDKMRDLSSERGGTHAYTEETDPGHIYRMPELGVLKRDLRDETPDAQRFQEIRFLKRSGGAIQYEEEWQGLQTQTVLRVCISRTRYLNSVLPCQESINAIRHMQNALWEYEARAFRRKIQALNREQPAHEEDIPIPFSPMDCEAEGLGADGHMPWLESAMLYIANVGWSDYQPWDSFWFSAEGPPKKRAELTPEQLAITRFYEMGIPKLGDA